MLNLINKKVTRGTAQQIASFVYDNRNSMSLELCSYYQSVKGMIDRQLTKPSATRMTMQEILERIYNIEEHILNSGAAEVTTVYI